MSSLVDSALSQIDSWDFSHIQPKQYSPAEHPYDTDLIRQDNGFTQVIELFIPHVFYTNNSQSLVQMNRTTPGYDGLAQTYYRMLQLFGYLANVPEDNPLKDKDYGGVSKRVYFEVVRQRVDIDDTDTLRITNDRYASEMIAGYRLRVVYLNPTRYHMGAILESLFKTNSRKQMLSMSKLQLPAANRATQTPLPLHFTYSRDQYYRDINKLFANIIDTRDPSLSYGLHELENPANPLCVFTMTRSMEMAHRFNAEYIACGACPCGQLGGCIEHRTLPLYFVERSELKTCTIAKDPMNEYRVFNGVVVDTNSSSPKEDKDPVSNGEGAEDEIMLSLPVASEDENSRKSKKIELITIHVLCMEFSVPFHGTEMYCIPASTIAPHVLGRYFFPNKHPLRDNNCEGLKVYLTMQLGPDYMNAPKEELDRISHIFFNLVNKVNPTETRNDFDSLRTRVKERRERCLHLAVQRHPRDKGLRDSYFRKLWEIEQVNNVNEFMTIFCENGDCSDTIKAIAKYGATYLSTSATRNFCMPMEKLTKNLCFFDDLLITRSVQQEVFQRTSMSHIYIDMYLACVWHVYFGGGLHPNILQVGVADSSKSHRLELMMSELIPGSFSKISWSSMQADMVDGNKGDLLIRVYDELPPPLFGVDPNPTKRGDNNNDPRLATLKTLLTTGELHYKSKTLGPNGEHVSVMRSAKVETVMVGNGNFTIESMAPSMASRVLTVQSGSMARVDGLTTIDKMQMKTSDTSNLVCSIKTIRSHRTQYLFALVARMVYCGILQMDMTGAGIINGQVVQMCAEKGFHRMNKARSFHYLESIQRSLTVWQAIHTYFDSIMSPLRDKPWDPHQILGIQKYLVCTQNLVTLSFGFMEQQYISPCLTHVRHMLMHEYKNDLDKAKSKPIPPQRSASTPSLSHLHESAIAVDNEEKQVIDAGESRFDAPSRKRSNPDDQSLVPRMSKQIKLTDQSYFQSREKEEAAIRAHMDSAHERAEYIVSYQNNPGAMGTYNNRQLVFSDASRTVARNKQIEIFDNNPADDLVYYTIRYPSDDKICMTYERQNWFANYLANLDGNSFTRESIRAALREIVNTRVVLCNDAGESVRASLSNFPIVNAEPRSSEESNSSMLIKEGEQPHAQDFRPLVVFGVNVIKVSYRFIYDTDDNIIRSTLMSILNHRNAFHQRYLYARPCFSVPYLYDFFDIRPTDTSPLLVIRNQNYVEQSLLCMATVGLGGTSIAMPSMLSPSASSSTASSSSSQKEMHMNDENDEERQRIIQSRQSLQQTRDQMHQIRQHFIQETQHASSSFNFIRFDCPIDEYSFKEHALNTYMTDEECRFIIGPHVLPTHHAKQLQQIKYRDELTCMYPDDVFTSLMHHASSNISNKAARSSSLFNATDQIIKSRPATRASKRSILREWTKQMDTHFDKENINTSIEYFEDHEKDEQNTTTLACTTTLSVINSNTIKQLQTRNHQSSSLIRDRMSRDEY